MFAGVSQTDGPLDHFAKLFWKCRKPMENEQFRPESEERHVW